MNMVTEPPNKFVATDKYRFLLKDIALLNEKHNARRSEPLNVFSVLRSESDEVNLHSRFLAALLDHKLPHNDERANLKEFLKKVARVDDFRSF